MAYSNSTLSLMLGSLDLGSSVAESDTVLETARIETSAFTDLLADRVDLVPGTKGSGKSALFRIFVDFLPDRLLGQKKVVVAHGIQAPGDPVFHAFADQFSKLSEEEFVSFWCIYLVSLAHEQFIKGPRYREMLRVAGKEIEQFRKSCSDARIPEIEAKKSLREILEWSLHTLASWRPKFKFQPPGDVGEFELNLFGSKSDGVQESTQEASTNALPQYVNEIKEKLESVLEKAGLSLWLMVDRLDEIFPRRSDVERTALRGILRATRFFSSATIRVKVFLRDDMLEQIVRNPEGFTALTHVTARQADTLRWTDDQILAMVVKRFCANEQFAKYLEINHDQLDASASYRKDAFGKIFPPKVFRGENQSLTIRWICSRCADGRGVVTPRDVLDLLIRAKQRQQDIYAAEPDGTSDHVIGAAAIQYGFEELSKRKKETYLEAEFPHFWKDIQKFSGGKTTYDAAALEGLLGRDWKTITENLLAIGFFSSGKKSGEDVFSIPFLYRHGMHLTRGQA
ncbi:MAG: hypothetical protein RB191_01190 [Terriglobia bacterium]|nr:hypothetical protein [Terriglobia bacterium]